MTYGQARDVVEWHVYDKDVRSIVHSHILWFHYVTVRWVDGHERTYYRVYFDNYHADWPKYTVGNNRMGKWRVR